MAPYVTNTPSYPNIKESKQACIQTSVLMCYNRMMFKTDLWHFRPNFTTKKKGSDHKWGREREMTSYSIRQSQFYIKLSTRLKFSLNFNIMAHKIFYFTFSLVFKASSFKPAMYKQPSRMRKSGLCVPKNNSCLMFTLRHVKYEDNRLPLQLSTAFQPRSHATRLTYRSISQDSKKKKFFCILPACTGEHKLCSHYSWYFWSLFIYI